MNFQEMHALLASKFENAILSVNAEAAQPYVCVDPSAMKDICLFLRDEPSLLFNRLLCMSGIDHEGFDEKGKGEHRQICKYEADGTVVPSEEDGTGDLGVVLHLESFEHKHQLCLHADTPRVKPEIASTSEVWTTADWHEREIFDFYGINFTGHPDMRRIFLPEDWEGFPLRKDYPMPTVYNEVPLEGLGLAVRDEK